MDIAEGGTVEVDIVDTVEGIVEEDIAGIVVDIAVGIVVGIAEEAADIEVVLDWA